MGKAARGGDHNRRARVNVSVTLPRPQYDGSRGKAAKFVQKFNHLVKTQDFAEQEWDSLLMDCLKKEALRHFENSRVEFPSHAAYFADLITFFDRRSINDERKFYLHYSMRQNEPIRTFYLRFKETTQQMNSLGLFPNTSDSNYQRTFMNDFFCRLNEECYSIVDNQLRITNQNPEDVPYSTFFSWIETSQKLQSSISALTKQQKQPPSQQQKKNNNNRKNNNSQNSAMGAKTEKLCYYCEKPGHRHRTFDKKTWLCPDKLAGKEPCANYKAYNKKKSNSGSANGIVATMEDRYFQLKRHRIDLGYFIQRPARLVQSRKNDT